MITLTCDRSVRVAILELLLDNMDTTTPNLTHFLCGFNVTSPIESDLESPSSLTCLHVIVSLLNSPIFSVQHPYLCELCYQFIYKLCADRNTGPPTMRFLRNRTQGNYVVL